MARVTVVVQSEFGRRVRENGSGGTDHGYGNPLLVLGGPVNGGRFYGTWAGLHPETLSPYFGDIPVTTDYRRVFAELLQKRMGHAAVDQVFPGFGNYTPLGLFASASASAAPRAVAPEPVRQPVRQAPQPALSDIRTTSAPAEVAGEAASGPIRHRRGTVHIPKRISQPLLRLRLRLYRLMQEHRL
jgi:hypothetical protein